MPTTRAFHKFITRSDGFDADLEMIDVIDSMQTAGKLHAAGSTTIFDYIDTTKHPILSTKQNSSNSRRAIVNHLRTTLYSSYIKYLYEDMSTYFKEVLAAAARNRFDANRLIGEHQVTFDANRILSSGSWQAILDMVSQDVFRKLEDERSTTKLLKKIDKKLGLGVDQNKIDSALPYLEIRHLLVHADGKADDDFCTKYPSISSTPGKLRLTFSMVSDGRIKIHELITEYDTKIISKNIVSGSDIKS